MDPVITNALWGNTGLAGVQWVLLDPQPQAVLRRALAALLPAPNMLGTCRIHRAKYKPGRRLTTYYEVTLRDPATGDERPRQIEVNWRPEEGADPRGAMAAQLAKQLGATTTLFMMFTEDELITAVRQAGRASPATIPPRAHDQ